MSTEITPEALAGKLHATSFWGGEKRGACVQLTPQHLVAPGYEDRTQPAVPEVQELAGCLQAWLIEHRQQFPSPKPPV